MIFAKGQLVLSVLHEKGFLRNFLFRAFSRFADMAQGFFSVMILQFGIAQILSGLVPSNRLISRGERKRHMIF